MQGKQQLHKLLLHESLVGQCKYTIQPKGSFWCQCVDAKGLLELFYCSYEIVLILSATVYHMHAGMNLFMIVYEKQITENLTHLLVN